MVLYHASPLSHAEGGTFRGKGDTFGGTWATFGGKGDSFGGNWSTEKPQWWALSHSCSDKQLPLHSDVRCEADARTSARQSGVLGGKALMLRTTLHWPALAPQVRMTLMMASEAYRC